MQDVIETGATVKEIAKAIRGEVVDRVVVEKEEGCRNLLVGFQSGKALKFVATGEGIMSDLAVQHPKEPPKDHPITVKELREKVWGMALNLTVEIEHARGARKVVSARSIRVSAKFGNYLAATCRRRTPNETPQAHPQRIRRVPRRRSAVPSGDRGASKQQGTQAETHAAGKEEIGHEQQVEHRSAATQLEQT